MTIVSGRATSRSSHLGRPDAPTSLLIYWLWLGHGLQGGRRRRRRRTKTKTHAPLLNRRIAARGGRRRSGERDLGELEVCVRAAKLAGAAQGADGRLWRPGDRPGALLRGEWAGSERPRRAIGGRRHDGGHRRAICPQRGRGSGAGLWARCFVVAALPLVARAQGAASPAPTRVRPRAARRSPSPSTICRTTAACRRGCTRA